MLQENQISDLINQSGRLRMLSHRASMMLSQIGAGVHDPWFLEQLQQSIQDFEGSLNHIQSELNAEPAVAERYRQFISKARGVELPIADVVANYLGNIKKYQRAIPHKTLPDVLVLSEFYKFVATDLLVCLNLMVSFFEDILSEISEQKLQKINGLAKDIEDSIDEVDQINLSIKILSFNASVEAARAGDVGRGFAVVSQEMNNLSSNTRKVTQNVKDTVNTFVDQLKQD